MTEHEHADQNCPRCGMAISQGSQPTTQGGVTYCCQACADGAACNCPGHNHS